MNILYQFTLICWGFIMKTIRSKLFAGFLVVAIMPLVFLGFFSYKISTETISQKVSNAVLTSLNQISADVDSKINTMQRYMDIFFTSKELQKILRQGDLTGYGYSMLKTYRSLDLIFSSYFYNEKNKISVYITRNPGGEYSYNSNNIVSRKQLSDNEWNSKTIELNGAINFVGTVKNPNQYSKIKYTYVLGRVIKDTKDMNDLMNLGVLYLIFDENVFADIYTETNKERNIIITNSNGFIISHNNKSLLNKKIKSLPYISTVFKNTTGYYRTTINNEQTLVAYVTSPTFGIKVIELIPYTDFTKEINSISYFTLYSVIFSVFVLLVLSYFVSRGLSLPISQLQLAMNKAEKGDFNISVSNKSKDEIGKMAQSFNNMLQKIKLLFEKSINDERLKKEAEIRALQYQINPHFVNNVLSSMRMIAMIENNMQIADMLKVMNGLVSRTIGMAGTFITIGEELENIKDFIYLQKIRLDNKLNSEYLIQREILEYKIPNLLLQPIVENAIFHGVRYKSDTPIITISGEKYNNGIIIIIQDNGIGMSNKQINDIMSGKANSYTHNCIGLKNVDDRIKLTFGCEYGLEIFSIPEKGTRVKITFPAVL